MKILLTNDDGIFSPGLAAMARVLRRLGDVYIVAPAAEQSGVGQAITFQLPLLVKEVRINDDFLGYAVEGTPVDCVKIGVGELLPCRPDLVVSGMNNGLNVGINIIYSGTVGAAMEGAMLGITSIAVSMQRSSTLELPLIERGAERALTIIRQLLDRQKSPGELFNLNIPNAAVQESECDSSFPVSVVPMDRTPFWYSYEKLIDPLGRSCYWLSGCPLYDTPNALTDIGAVSQGRIAITPLDFDVTKRSKMSELESWQLTSPSIQACQMESNPGIRILRKGEGE